MIRSLHRNIIHTDNLSFGFIGFFACLPVRYVPYVAAVFILIQLSIIILSKAKHKPHLSSGIIILLIFFVFELFSLIYSDNIHLGLKEIETDLSFFLIPLIFIFNKMTISKVRYFFNGIVFGGIMLMLILSTKLIFNNFFGDSFNNLEDIVNSYSHHTYVATYILIGLLYSVFSKLSNFSNRYILAYAIASLGFVYVSNSNSAIMASSIIIAVIIIKKALKLPKSRLILYSPFAVIIIVCTIYFSPDLTKYLDPNNYHMSNIDMRFQLWETAFQLIKEKPILGYGLGSSKEALVNLYQESNFHTAAIKELNAHNEFVQILLDTGMISLVIFSIYFSKAFFFNKNRPEFIGYLGLLFVFIFFFESYLQRVTGVFIFCVLTQILVNSSSKDLVPLLLNTRVFKILSITLGIILIIVVLLEIFSWKFDSSEPATYAGTKYENVINLPEPRPTGIPATAKGYKLDSSSINTIVDSTIYSYSKIRKIRVNSNDSIYSTVYCYVSSDFNGSEVRLSGREQILPPRDSYYNLKKKGTWQKLEINSACNLGEALLVLTVAKHEETDSRKLNGWVIFCYPEASVH